MRSTALLLVISITFVAPFAAAAPDKKSPPASDEAAGGKSPPPAQKPQDAPKCEQHGVKKTICARCNPKLEKVFKAKGDWCAEHSRPESQCVLCNPKLAKEGVK
jgi:hypothetical protein